MYTRQVEYCWTLGELLQEYCHQVYLGVQMSNKHITTQLCAAVSLIHIMNNLYYICMCIYIYNMYKLYLRILCKVRIIHVLHNIYVYYGLLTNWYLGCRLPIPSYTHDPPLLSYPATGNGSDARAIFGSQNLVPSAEKRYLTISGETSLVISYIYVYIYTYIL